MQRDRHNLTDILESSKLAIEYLKNQTIAEFLSDVEKQDAVIRRLEIIGEAARRVSDECRESYPELPWHSMTSMRNVMIHEYDDVDLNIVWNTVKNDLPSLVEMLEKAIR